MAQKSMMESVKGEIVSAIKGTGDIVNAVVDTVAGTLTNTIKGTGAVATSVVRTLSERGPSWVIAAARLTPPRKKKNSRTRKNGERHRADRRFDVIGL